MGRYEDPAEKNGHKPIPPPTKDDEGDGTRGK